MDTNRTQSLRISSHAADQAQARGINLEAATVIVVDKLRDRRAASAAVLLGTLPTRRAVIDGSNGDQVWAIVRGNTLATLMLRRQTQPTTLDAFGVQAVVL